MIINLEHSENLSKDEIEVYCDRNKVGYISQYNGEELFDEILKVYDDCINSISGYKLSEIHTGFSYIEIPLKLNNLSQFNLGLEQDSIIISFDRKEDIYADSWIPFKVDLQNWQNPFSFKRFIDKCNSLIKENHEISYELEFDDNLLSFSLKIKDPELKISDIIKNIHLSVNSLFEKSIQSLMLEFKSNSFTSIFKFPHEIKTACEQYLIYFSKFLEDLGIEAETSIENEAQNVLFTVTPNDPNQALAQIRDALNTYLSLPSENDLEKYSSNFKDISVQQLLSNVYHLKSQLILSQSIIQAKDATIQSLEFLNLQNKMIIENKADSETVIPKILSVEKYKGKGFTVDLPELFRLLKRTFK